MLEGKKGRKKNAQDVLVEDCDEDDEEHKSMPRNKIDCPDVGTFEKATPNNDSIMNAAMADLQNSSSLGGPRKRLTR